MCQIKFEEALEVDILYSKLNSRWVLFRYVLVVFECFPFVIVTVSKVTGVICSVLKRLRHTVSVKLYLVLKLTLLCAKKYFCSCMLPFSTRKAFQCLWFLTSHQEMIWGKASDKFSYLCQRTVNNIFWTITYITFCLFNQ